MRVRPFGTRRTVAIGAIALLVLATFGIVLTRLGRERAAHLPRHAEPHVDDIPGLPELSARKQEFAAGFAALERNDPDDAILHLESFSFGARAVEEYRLYFLATGYQLAGKPNRARRSLAQLWRRQPSLVYRDDIGFNLASLYASRGDFSRAHAIYTELASRAEAPAVAATARSEALRAAFHAGDPGAMLYASRELFIHSPRSADAKRAAAVAQALMARGAARPLPMTIPERIARGEALLAHGGPREALDDLAAIDAEALGSPLRERVLLARGESLQRMGRYEDSDRTLQPLFSGYYRWAAPAIFLSAENNRLLASRIQAEKTRTVKEKQKAGTVKVKRKGKTVTQPKYKTVTRTIRSVDPALAMKKDAHQRIYVDRLKDVLKIPSPHDINVKALNALIAIAAEKDQDPYLRELVPQLVKLEPYSDPALQRFWDAGWAAYKRGDFAAARIHLTFVSETYTNPNIRRQARYWLARTHERQGEKDRARAIYQQLADAPYDDLYALFSERRGAKRKPLPKENPLHSDRPDWPEAFDEEMPDELRLAFELHLLGAHREARAELQRKAGPENRRHADMILGSLYAAAGVPDLTNRYIRRAFPQLATIEQDAVPPYFLRLYHPLRYEETIRENAKRYDLDPYLVMALIRQESAFNPRARSPVGASGLMQLMPATARELQGRILSTFGGSLEDPEVNIRLGTHYFSQLIRLLKGELELAIAGYNGGPYRIKRWREANPSQPLDEFLEGIPLSETRGYVKRVIFLRSAYTRLYGTEAPRTVRKADSAIHSVESASVAGGAGGK
jgi:soluble lytic murein transglycosylase-like protein